MCVCVRVVYAECDLHINCNFDCCVIQRGGHFLQMNCHTCCDLLLPVSGQHFSQLLQTLLHFQFFTCQRLLQRAHTQSGACHIHCRCQTSLIDCSKFRHHCHSHFRMLYQRRPNHILLPVHRWRQTVPWLIQLQVCLFRIRRLLRIPHPVNALASTKNFCRFWPTLSVQAVQLLAKLILDWMDYWILANHQLTLTVLLRKLHPHPHLSHRWEWWSPNHKTV